MKKSIALSIIVLLSATLRSQTLLPSVFNHDTILNSSHSPYLVQASLTVPVGIVLKIEPGVTIEFGAGATLNIQGTLIAKGLPEDSIFFVARNASSWLRINSTNADVDIEYSHVSGSKMMLWASGGNSITIVNCHIESLATGSGEDCIAVHDAKKVKIDNLNLVGMGGHIAQGSKNDAIDLDDVDSCFVTNSIIRLFSDDGVDIGTNSKYAMIAGNNIWGCNYGVTVGESSLAYIDNNILAYCDGGIQVHTHAVIYADYNTIYHNTWGIECYHSEEGNVQTGGTAYVKNTIFAGTVQTEILLQTSSVLTISYSISDRETLPGNHNLRGDPKLSDPQHGDYRLQPGSPCFHTGSPDPENNPTSMGAWGGLDNPVTSIPRASEMISLSVYPNPVIDIVHFQSTQDIVWQRMELYNSNGRLIMIKNMRKGTYAIDISSCQAGIYLLRLSAGQKVSQAYIIKE
jgi:hypothetical protein